MRTKQPLLRRIVAAFVLMTTLVSGVFALGIVAIVHLIEEHLVSEGMYRELRIPRHPATQSALIWPGIPRPSGHLFHGHPAGQSERSDAGVALLV